MDNSYFLFSKSGQELIVERFHICNWEFQNGTTLVEFGCEVKSSSIVRGSKEIQLGLHLPWLDQNCTTADFYSKLKDSKNSRFIFNDSVHQTKNFDGGKNENGVIHEFSNRNKLCILPVKIIRSDQSREIGLSLNLSPCAEYLDDSTNVYFRFAIEPKKHISVRKGLLSKSTIIYDIKLNELRNLPDKIEAKSICQVNTCFCFNIIPNSYDLVFFDNSSLKNVRTLEYDSFNKYLGDKRVNKDELIVVFNKRKAADSHSFFSIYAREKIGISQLTIAILINLFSGFLLFIPSVRLASPEPLTIYSLPLEYYILAGIWAVGIPFVIFYRKLARKFNWL